MKDHPIKTEDPAAYGTAPAPASAYICRWTHDDEDGYWATVCDHAFEFIDGGPSENEFRFCPYCGREIIAVFEPTGEGADPDDGAP